MEPQVITSYLNNALAFGLRQKSIEKVVEGIKANNVEFDVIAFTGLSGAMIAPPVADRLGKPLIAVRKEKTCHTTTLVEGCNNLNTYIIVDDCIATGATVKAIRDKIKEAPQFSHYQLVAVFLYGGHTMKRCPHHEGMAGVPVYG